MKKFFDSVIEYNMYLKCEKEVMKHDSYMSAEEFYSLLLKVILV